MRKKAREVLLAFKGSDIREAFAPRGGEQFGRDLQAPAL